jgi:hypothetical protein
MSAFRGKADITQMAGVTRQKTLLQLQHFPVLQK